MRTIAPDLDVRVWLGRSQPGMCSDLDSVREARARMLDPQQHVCDGCAYQELPDAVGRLGKHFTSKY